METVRSRDNIPIAYQRSGKGPSLVLVHGTTADYTRWAPLLPELGRHFTVYAMDRRGRGLSGDSEPYALEQEFDDVVAVVDAAGPEVNLLGHSYGALCAMEAALRTSNLRRMVLYEPVFPVDEIEIYPPGAAEKLQELLDRGQREPLLTAYFRDVVGMSDREIEAVRSEPSWAGRLAAAHTLVREMADGDYAFEPERFRGFAVPTLLLVGEKSPAILKRPTEWLASVLPDSRVVAMRGQGHAAMSTAPDLFLKEVIAFLTE
jgi:pimeloyl-ACP methyl ester carboxylesterase